VLAEPIGAMGLTAARSASASEGGDTSYVPQ